MIITRAAVASSSAVKSLPEASDTAPVSVRNRSSAPVMPTSTEPSAPVICAYPYAEPTISSYSGMRRRRSVRSSRVIWYEGEM